MQRILLLLILLMPGCESAPEKFRFIDDFNENRLGWVEESTDFHYFDIRDGSYFMQSKDTSYARSSTGPIDISFLLELPEKYLIESKIKYISGSEFLECGIILYGASLEYKFSIAPSGNSYIEKYDYNLDQSMKLDSINIDGSPFQSLTQSAKLQIVISGNRFDFWINNQYVGGGISQTEIWHDLRFFTGPPMAIEVLYLRILELTEEELIKIYDDENDEQLLST